MAATTRSRITLAIGVLMLLLGAYIALRLVWTAGRPLTASPWLDVAFAAFFVLRGLMNVASGRKGTR